jgi:hypothetical protein
VLFNVFGLLHERLKSDASDIVSGVGNNPESYEHD